MELVSQHTKCIMEECKRRARDEGLACPDDTLEYIVTNRDLIELHPKMMIPTLYDYWVHDIDTIAGQKRYDMFPHNAYETVINTRPPISFYNDNNPDWLNVMIFYHVIAHIDFFQQNSFFKHTWNDDFKGKALADKRLLRMLRTKHGRWVDYVIEFARGIDNICGYHEELSEMNIPTGIKATPMLNYYFSVFLQDVKKVSQSKYLEEIKRYNRTLENSEGLLAESFFFANVRILYPEFDALFEEYMKERKKEKPKDVMEYIIEESPFLNKEENKWMKIVMKIVRDTAILTSEPQIRTKVFNEGWASYWHNRLFLKDNRMRGHEVDYARVNAWITAISRVGLNPYAIGMRMIEHIRDYADKGRYCYDYEKLTSIEARERFERKTGKGDELIFGLRSVMCDFTLINRFVDQEFVDRYNLFVVGRRLNMQKGVWEYYIKSRKAEDYKNMLIEHLYHPPHITVDKEKTKEGKGIYLIHHFEGKNLKHEWVPNTMMGLEFLWGGPVSLETIKIVLGEDEEKPKYTKVIYTMTNKQITKKEEEWEGK